MEAADLRSAPSAGNWHLRLFEKSVVKQMKLRALLRMIPPTEGKTCLDLGGDNGVVSCLLRRRGGTWHSADMNEDAVESIRSLVGERVHRTDGASMPFPDGMFDLVVVIDYLEHVRDDRGCAAELRRILAPGGELVVNVPHRKGPSAAGLIRRTAGLTDADHGHVRPGYTRGELEALLGGGFRVTGSFTYSRFFTEMIDIAVNLGCSASSGDGVRSNKGLLITADKMAGMERAFRLYGAVYPFLRLLSGLDALLFFTRGHRLIVRAVRR